MNRLYCDKRWYEFREEIFEMDGYICTKCGRSSSEVVLQVHHKEYQAGKAPWDYPPKLCETLCKGCHAREHGEIRPNEGWSLYSQDDLGGLYGNCECCNTPIRYAFFIHHEKWEPLTVGTVCCDNLTGTTEATEFRKHLDRKKRFMSPKRWERTSIGINTTKGRWLKIEVQSENQIFRIYMNEIQGHKVFDSEKLAMEFAFNLIENGEAQSFAKRHPLQKYSK